MINAGWRGWPGTGMLGATASTRGAARWPGKRCTTGGRCGPSGATSRRGLEGVRIPARCRAACTSTCSPPASSPTPTSTRTSGAGLDRARSTGATRPRSTAHADGTSASTSSSSASTPSPPSRSTAPSWPRTANMHRSYRIDVAHAAAPGPQHAGRHVRVRRSARRRPCARRRLGPRPHVNPTRTTRSARWPAASAGTGARTSSPPASGGRSRCTAGGRAPRRGAAAGRCGRRHRPGRGPRRPRARADAAADLQVAVGGAGRHGRGCRRRRRRRRRRSRYPTPRAVVAARPRRPAALRPDRHCRRRRGRCDDGADRVGFRTVELDTTPDGDGTAVRVRRQRRTRLRQGRQLDPRRRLPAPGHPRALRRTGRPGRRGGRQPAAGLGRRHLRERRLLRRVRRARHPGLAGLPVRLCGLRRGGAAARRGGRRGARQRHPADAPPEPGAVERRQREPAGATRTGAGRSGSDGRSWGRGYYHDVLPGHRRRARPRPPVHARAARGRPAPAGTPTTPPTAACTSGTCGTSLDYTAYRDLPSRGSSPSSAGRGRRPGPRCAARSTTIR